MQVFLLMMPADRPQDAVCHMYDGTLIIASSGPAVMGILTSHDMVMS